MATKPKSRWETAEDDPADLARLKAEKESKKHLKAQKDRRKAEAAAALATSTASTHVDNYELLNHIEEGSYGIVSRARDTSTGEIVALKKLKLEREKDGFPITSLREIQTLMICKHPNIINLREVVMGDRLDHMHEPFLPSETKTLLLQLVSATHFMHTNWILHRDLKTSNLLMNNRGQIKVADFGLARLISDPPQKHLTRLLLLGAKEYGPEVDMWSIGCIFAELLTKEPLFKGTTEVDQISKIFTLLGVPTEASWPGYRRLPHAKSLTFPRTPATTGSQLRTKFPMLTNQGFDLLSRLLCLDPARRITAEEVLKHEYFREEPRPKREEMFRRFRGRGGGRGRLGGGGTVSGGRAGGGGRWGFMLKLGR
ncbi:kinase-like domain-containing protein [Terfezia claveryi]|nr:kinase-like domain-containing protein [Terfezia claveryi]